MPKIVRAGGVNLSDDVVKIRDIGPGAKAPEKKKPKLPPAAELPEEGDEVGLDDGMQEDAGFAPQQEDAAEFEPEEYAGQSYGMEESAVQGDDIRDGIIQSAMAEAGRILENAVREAESQKAGILASVEGEAEQMRHNAAEQGRQEGYDAVSGTVRAAVDELQGAIARFEGARAGFEVEYEEQLRWMALEIAAKVLDQKVSEDDAILTAMVDKAVQSVRSEAWVRVEVSQEMTHLIDKLTGLYSEQPNVEVSAVPLTPGTIQIETPTGTVDASLRTQLDNLRQYFTQNSN